jgi:Tfp pilus assembly protein PilV
LNVTCSPESRRVRFASLPQWLVTNHMTGGVSGQRRRSGERGIALLEVLIGGVVLAISIIGLSLMLTMSGTMVMAQGDQYVALYLAQQKVEEFIAVGFTAGVGTTTTTESNITGGESGTQTFTRVTTVTYSGGPPATTEQVSVTVTPLMHEAAPATLAIVLTNHPA